MVNIIGIYKITSPSGKIYIGSSKNIKKREFYYNSVSCKNQTKIYNSIKKYGWEAHLFEIIEECSLEELYKKEIYYGLLFNVLGKKGLNCVLPKNDDIKSSISDETRQKMSEAKKGNKNTFYGKKHTAETRAKISKAQTGRKHTEEHKLKVSQNSARAKAKKVINQETQIIYDSAIQASKVLNINYSTLRQRLNGSLKNTTQLRYL